MPDHVLHDDAETQSKLRRCCNSVVSYITQRRGLTTTALPEAVYKTRLREPIAQADNEDVKNVSRPQRQFNTRSVSRILDGTYDNEIEVSPEDNTHGLGPLLKTFQITSDTETPNIQRTRPPAKSQR